MKNSTLLDFITNLLSAESLQSTYNALGILGFVLSALLWFFAVYKKRTNLYVESKDYTKALGEIVQLYLYIQNQSDSPITISGISIVHYEKKLPCELIPKKIRKTGDNIIYTPCFPINLAPQQGVCFPFEFLNCRDIEVGPGKKVALEIYTNRKLVKESLILNQPNTLLHL